MKAVSKIVAATLFALATTASAQDAHHAHGHGHGHEAAAPVQLVDGEVKKIDKDAGKITIRHGEIKNLGMGAMTMVFRTKEASMLDQVKVGDKIKFAAEKVNGVITVTQLQK